MSFRSQGGINNSSVFPRHELLRVPIPNEPPCPSFPFDGMGIQSNENTEYSGCSFRPCGRMPLFYQGVKKNTTVNWYNRSPTPHHCPCGNCVDRMLHLVVVQVTRRPTRGKQKYISSYLWGTYGSPWTQATYVAGISGKRERGKNGLETGG